MHSFVYKGQAEFQPFLTALALWALKLVKARVAQTPLCHLEQTPASLWLSFPHLLDQGAGGNDIVHQGPMRGCQHCTVIRVVQVERRPSGSPCGVSIMGGGEKDPVSYPLAAPNLGLSI